MENFPQKIIQIITQLKFIAFDFDGVFTNNAVYVTQSGEEIVRCSRSDGLGLERLRSLGIQLAVISTEENPVVSKRCEKLKLECIQSCSDKLKALTALLVAHGIKLNQAAFVGNDTNDLACLEVVSFPVVVNDAHPDVLPHALYRTDAKGGYGAVRELCDLVYQIKTTAALGVKIE